MGFALVVRCLGSVSIWLFYLLVAATIAQGLATCFPLKSANSCSRSVVSGMTQDLRNVFISHIHEDDGGLRDLKDLAARHGLICRDGSITKGKFNSASNEHYIKYQILAPRINWASVLVVYVSPETKDSDWVNWEIEYAHNQGKRIVGVWEWGARDCEPLPEALNRYADAVVGWNGESMRIDAINGTSDESHSQDGSEPGYRSIPRHSMPMRCACYRSCIRYDGGQGFRL